MSDTDSNLDANRPSPESKRREEKSQFIFVLRILLAIAIIVGCGWLVYRLRQVLLLIVLAIFFAYIIAPLVGIVERLMVRSDRLKALSRPLSIAVVYLGFFLVIGILFYSLVPFVSAQITQLIGEAPIYNEKMHEWSQGIIDFYHRYKLPAEAEKTLVNTLDGAINAVVDYAKARLFSIVQSLTYVIWLILIPVLAFFFLRDGEQFRRNAILLIPKGHLRWRADQFIGDISRTLAAYIRAQLIACVLIGTVCTIGFAIIGLPYALVLGLLAGLLEFIPMIGPLVVMIIAATFAGFQSPGQVIVVLVFLIIFREVQDYVIYPKIIGKGIRLHPLAIILAVLCGAELAGIVGVFLAVPTVAILSVTHRHLSEYKAIEDLVAESAERRKTLDSPPAEIELTD